MHKSCHCCSGWHTRALCSASVRSCGSCPLCEDGVEGRVSCHAPSGLDTLHWVGQSFNMRGPCLHGLRSEDGASRGVPCRDPDGIHALRGVRESLDIVEHQSYGLPYCGASVLRPAVRERSQPGRTALRRWQRSQRLASGLCAEQDACLSHVTARPDRAVPQLNARLLKRQRQACQDSRK
jgi:hypothetical protein